jgi:hypothetical protein
MESHKFRRERLVVKLTNFEKELLRKEAEAEGLCVAHLIRKLIKENIVNSDSQYKEEMLAVPKAFFWEKRI